MGLSPLKELAEAPGWYQVIPHRNICDVPLAIKSSLFDFLSMVLLLPRILWSLRVSVILTLMCHNKSVVILDSELFVKVDFA